MPDIARILKADRPLTLARVARGAQPLVLSDLARAAKGRAVFIVPDDTAMHAVSEAARFFASELEVIEFPAWDSLPYDRASPALSISARRLAALHRLQAGKPGAQLLVTTANAALQRVLTPFRIRESVREFAPGMEIGRESLSALLQRQGYSRTDTVIDKGEYAIRGSIVDVFPSGMDEALRLDFFGDELESLRSFDPNTQLTTGRLDRHLLLPASEALLDEDSIKRFRTRYREMFGANATQDPLYEAVSEGRRLAGMEHWLPLFEDRLTTLFDHLGKDDLVVIDQAALAAAEERTKDVGDYYEQRKAASGQAKGSYRPLKPDALYLTQGEFETALADAPAHRATAFDEPESDSVPKSGRRPLIAAYSKGSRSRIVSILDEAGIAVQTAESWQEALGQAAKGKPSAMIVPLEASFANDELELLTEQDILGDRLVRRKKKRRDADAFLAELQALSVGDLIVHTEHGIGKYLGLEPIAVGKSKHDCVQLEYRGGDKLFIPVENIDVLSRYGSSEEAVQLDRLGGEAWQKRRARLKERIQAIAGELMQVAAARALRKAPVLEVEEGPYNQFLDRFQYEETDDQDRAIADVLSDLESGKPMDRLVCGDVGFGKTEVALRAAFVAAMAGVQVAVVCPTTLLARQHFTNFVDRFKGFPINIGRLSRLVPAAEAARTRDGLASGQIDIVVGTHAVFAKAVEFQRLGLVIVDEEQRFGVVHKERLKQLKADVHVLTLTATPIPRTLQMAMSGLRELSVIQTPPVDRLAVRTYVAPWDPVVIREALLREHDRGGQSFFVTPRIKDLPDIEEFLRTRVPEIKYVVAHGQMAPGEVEERMSAFYDRKYDVLVSTTIVESGLDIPSANTLIVHRADRFGLAQLYQLRGRVGRSKTRAYAYLTTPEGGAITDTAEKRLKLLGDLDTLGAGFQLASHDLDIRGAGNLVGDEQSGHIREVGFELYQSMLEEAILVAKAEGAGVAPPREALSPVITVDAPILIPEDYVPDLPLRMALYRRLNEAEDRAGLDGFAAEMIDRFGPLPPETANLIQLMEIKANARAAAIAKLDVGTKGALVSFHGDQFANVPGLIAYVERLKGRARIRPDNKLSVSGDWGSAGARLNGALQLSKGLGKLAKQAG